MKKILFTGFMASILTIAGAYAANNPDTLGTELTTKSYVDGAALWAKGAADAAQTTASTALANAATAQTTANNAASAASAAQAAAEAAQTTASTALANAATAQADADALETLVGTLPSGITATTVIGYVNEKTGAISEQGEDISALEERMTAAEGNIDDLESGKVDKVSGSSLVADTKVTSYDAHIANTTIHVTSDDKAEWSGKQDALGTAQLAAVNSGITSDKVATYDGYATTIGALQDAIEDLITVDTWDSEDLDDTTGA